MSEIEHLVVPALRAAGRPTTYENQERMRKALMEAVAHTRAEAVGVKDASYTEMLIDNAACASQCDFDAVTREAIRLNIIDPLLALAHPAVPEGMVAVPREPSASMRVAGIDAAYEQEKGGQPLRASIYAAYRAMIAAAKKEGE